MPCAELAGELDRRGAVVVSSALTEAGVDVLWASIRPENAAGAVRTRARGAYGARGLLVGRPELRRLFAGLGLDALAGRALGGAAFPIDALYFDKRSDVNWAVPAHQDVVVPVANAMTVRNARERHGLRYGEPDDHVLEELVALRVHFDDATADSGGLAIVDGSHAKGRLSDSQLRGLAPDLFTPYDCRAGDVLLMKPLVVHRSGRSTAPTHRRVLHILYAPGGGCHDRCG